MAQVLFFKNFSICFVVSRVQVVVKHEIKPAAIAVPNGIGNSYIITILTRLTENNIELLHNFRVHFWIMDRVMWMLDVWNMVKFVTFFIQKC
jgi:hypothetical protein